MHGSFNKYHAEVLRILDKFKKAYEWSDFIEPLDSLCAVFKKYNAGYVPCIPQLVKRLNQLLNPALPGGVHLKTIECYNVMFDYINRENLVKDFDVLTVGLFNFSTSCRIIVANEYLDLLEKIISQLGPKIESFSKYVIYGFLPFLESESSDFYNRAYLILISFLNQVSEKVFYTALWKNFVEHQDLRISILNFLNKHKVVAIPDYNLVTKAFCLGLEGDNPFIIRPVLEMSNRDFPYTIESITQNLNEKGDHHEQDVKVLPAVDVKLSPSLASSSDRSSVEMSSVQIEPKAQQIIKDLISEQINDSSGTKAMDVINKDKDQCNASIIRGVLKIFLKKEVGMHRRAYKWLNISETIMDRDIDYIEKGLRTYLNGTEEDLSSFFRIINALADKENLIVFLMERLILDAIQIMMKIDEKKNVESFYFVKKNIRTFLNHSLDEFYRVIYMKLNRIFNEANEIDRCIEDYSDFDMESTSSDSATLKSCYTLDKQDTNAAEQLLRLVVYSFEVLDAVDSNVTSIHIPLLCHLVIRNKKKISHGIFSGFLDIFLEKCEGSLSLEPREVSCSLINSFYQKESPNELLEISLIGALAKELGKLEIYGESSEDSIFWADSKLTMQNGILVWSETKNIYRIDRPKEDYFNFGVEDVQILQKFIRKHGHKDFPEDFLQNLGKYLAYNYKFIDLINSVSYYVDYSLLRVNLWNDFILSKNPKYLMHFQEEFLLPFILEILPTVNLKDICLFLEESLKIGRYYDILFRVATIVDQRSSEFVSLLLNLNDIQPLLKSILDRYYLDSDSSDPYKYDTTIAILFLLQNLAENENFLKGLLGNIPITLDKYGDIGIQEALSNMLFAAMAKNEERRHAALEKEQSEKSRSIIFEYRKDESIHDSSSAAEHQALNCDDSVKNEHQVSKYADGVDLEHSLRLLNISSTVNNYNRVYKFIFNILYKLHKKSVQIAIPDISQVKGIIRECKSDFYIMKRSVFLVSDDVSFIYENYMHFYKPILAQINDMPIKESFFAYLIDAGTKCSVEIMTEALQYILPIKGIKKDELFRKCFAIMADECRRSCAIYKKVRGYYRKIDKKLLADENSIQKENEEDAFATTKFSFKSRITESELSALSDLDDKSCLPSLVLIKCCDLENVRLLATNLFSRNPALFVSSMPNNHTTLYLFGALTFKAELYEKILTSLKSTKLSMEVFQMLTKLLPLEVKTDIIRSKAEYLRNTFGMHEPDVKTMKMLLELFKYMPSSDLLKITISNIVHSLIVKAEHLQRYPNTNFDEEMKILEKIIKMPSFSSCAINLLKNCCFTILTSKEYQDSALGLVHLYLQTNPNCKIFIDAYINYFYRSFFDFGVLAKMKIFEVISSSPSFDSFGIINNLIAGMEPSIFSTVQSEELQRINNLKKMSFLILSQPRNKFSSMSDTFVKIINDLINSTSEVRIELIRFSTVLMLKIDNHYLQTLFPILVADFMISVFTKDLKVVKEIFRFVDISIWLNSPVFTFKVLFSENHTFYNQLKSQILYETSNEPEVNISARKLPNFLTNAFDKITSWSQLSLYLKNAPAYYDYIELHMAEKDYECVIKDLGLSYCDT